MNIASTLAHGRRHFPERPALLFEGQTISYAALDAAADRAAAVLRALGIVAGDRVALLLPNVPAFAYAYFGALKLGAIVVSINVGLTADEVRFLLEDSGAVALIVDAARAVADDMRPERLPSVRHVLVSDVPASNADALPPAAVHGGCLPFEDEMSAIGGAALEPADLEPASPAVIVYTSGTTGVPKGATLSHGNVTFAMRAKQRYLDIRPDDRLLLFLPLYHCFGQNAILNAGLQAGATVVLQRGFDAGRVLEAIARDGVTMLFGVPATFIVLLERAGTHASGTGVRATGAAAGDAARPAPLGQVRYCFSAAAPLPIAVEQAWHARFGLVLHQGYGLTETSPFASYNHRTRHRAGSIGAPIDQVEMAIADVQTGQPVADGEIGEIVIRGPNVMLGYWNRPDDTAAAIVDGWFRTGDIGRRDAEGYFFIEDRLKDMVIVGGSNVYPVEVENVLFRHPGVADAAVYGVPDQVLGERVRAAVVLASAASADTGTAATSQRSSASASASANRTAAVTEADLIAWCRARLAAFKTPAAVEIVTELPRNRTGKVLKRVLRDRHAASQRQPLTAVAMGAASASDGSAPHAGAAHASDARDTRAFAKSPSPSLSPSPSSLSPSSSSALQISSPPATEKTGAAPAASAHAIQDWIAQRLERMLDRRGRAIDPDGPLVDHGLTSIDAVDLAADLERWLGRPVPPTVAWAFPTLRALAEHLAAVTAPAQTNASHTADEPIAIVGMACRYPGADGLDAFWDLLRHGRDGVTEVPKKRWDLDTFYHPDPAVPGKMTSRWAGTLDSLEEFDAAFFGITPREAPHVDPRQRLALEIAWEALEDAKIPPDSLAGTRAGVFMATLTNDYDHLLFNDLQRADAYSGAGTANSIVANRLSYFLDLRGPSLALDTACSGSLVCLHLACESLRRGESTLALAGGVNVNLMPKSNVFFSKAGALSPTGRCRTFDRTADGMVRSDGAGIVVLKTLSQAQRDGDTIVALITGSAVNHDGRSNGLMAPNGAAQEAVLTEAYRRAGVAPSDVQYVEAHGTGTRLGDPIEVQALGAVLTPGRRADRRCLLGSVKTNIGHSEAAAGIAGVIKTALALKHRLIPPTLHFTEPNPLIAFDRLPFDVPRAASAWPSPAAPLIAGVSGFGFGGANAHVVLQAPDASAPASLAGLTIDEATRDDSIRAAGWPSSLSSSPAAHAMGVSTSGSTIAGVDAKATARENAMTTPHACVLPISARTPQALETLARAYRDRLAAGDIVDLRAFCAAAATGRTHHARRLALAGSSPDALCAQLDRWLADSDAAQLADTRPSGRLVFVFSGQGSHWPRMTGELYAQEPRFRAALDECDRLFAPLTGLSIIEEIGRDAAQSRLDDTTLTQPAIFAVQWALLTLWRAFGITPDAVVGHSLGEVAAACAAGAITLADGVRIVFHRSRLMARAAGRGRTAVVGLSFDEARAAIRDYEPALAVAGSNGPTTSVVAGEPEAIERLLADLGARGLFCRAIPGVDIAFHSPQMDPLRDELEQSLAGLTPARPGVPILSTVTGTFAGLSREDGGGAPTADTPAFDAAYWGRNLREPFRFGAAIARLLTDGCRAFVEVSPHAVLSSAIVQCVRHAELGAAAPAVLCSIRKGERERATLLGQLAQLYERGESIDWTAVCGGRGRESQAALPAYPWQRQRFWFDQLRPAPVAQAQATATTREGDEAPHAERAGANAAHPLLGERIEPAVAMIAGGADRLYLWEKAFDASHPAWFADHRVLDDVFVPGAAFLEMATAAARQVWPGGALAVGDVQFEQALRLSTTRRRVQATLSVHGDAAEFQVFSRVVPADDARATVAGGGTGAGNPLSSWTRHVVGRVLRAVDDGAAARAGDAASSVECADHACEPLAPAPADVALDLLRARCREVVTPEAHYDAMKRGGLDYGPAFRGIRQLWAGPGEALADVRLLPALADPRYHVHPTLLDAALQVVAAAVRRDDANSYLPKGMLRWRVFRSTGDRVWCHARLVATSPSVAVTATPAGAAATAMAAGDTGTLTADIDLIDDAGRIVAQAEGLALARVGIRRANPLDSALLEERWHPQALDARVAHGAASCVDLGVDMNVRVDASAAADSNAASAAWLVLADSSGLGASLAARLRASGQRVIVARTGAAYRRIDAQQTELRPDRAEDMRELIAGAGPLAGVAHAWSLDARPLDENAASAGDDAPLTHVSALHLTQALAGATATAAAATGSAAPTPRLWFVTRRAFAVDRGPLDLSQAPLAGFALTVAQEHPELRCSSIDIDADAPFATPAARAAHAAQDVQETHEAHSAYEARAALEACAEPSTPADDAAALLATELLGARDESRIAFRGGVRFVARLERVAATTQETPADLRLRRDATYLITGGLGALGLRTAAAFAARGAGHLLLTGRRGASGKQAAIDAIARLGATVTIVEADIASAADADRLFTGTLAHLPPLAGVVHAAGVLDDGLIGQQSIERFAAVMAPKVRGAWHLHRHTRDRELDFFVLYSSAASLVGSAGQSNYAAGNAFLDALAHHRRALGLPAASINWGAWEEDGMAATPAMRVRLEARGVRFIQPGDALPLLCTLLQPRHDSVAAPADAVANEDAGERPAASSAAAPEVAGSRAAIGVMPVDWDRFLQQFPAGVPTRFERLATPDAAIGSASRAAGAAASTAAGRDAWRAGRSAPKATRIANLRRAVSQDLRAVLGFDASQAIAADERYFDLGMDSLMAVELKNRLQQTFGVPLPATLAFEYPTVDSIAALLDETFAAMHEHAEAADPLPSHAPEADNAAASAADTIAVSTAASQSMLLADEALDLDTLSAEELTQLLARELAEDSPTSSREEGLRVR